MTTTNDTTDETTTASEPREAFTLERVATVHVAPGNGLRRDAVALKFTVDTDARTVRIKSMSSERVAYLEAFRAAVFAGLGISLDDLRDVLRDVGPIAYDALGADRIDALRTAIDA